MHTHLARGHRQRGDGLADNADDLCGIGLELPAHDLPRQGHRQGEKLALHLGIQGLERLGQVVEHPRQALHLGANLGAAGLAAFGKSLLEGLLVRFRLQIGEPAHRRHFLRGK